MDADWSRIVFAPRPAAETWAEIFSTLLDLALASASPVALHEQTVVPDRLLSEAAWELWAAFPEHCDRTVDNLVQWSSSGSGKAVLVLDSLSLKELAVLAGAAEERGIQPVQVKATGAECPTSTRQFAKALGLPSRASLAGNGQGSSLLLFGGNCHADASALPFDDCKVAPAPNLVYWHSWLDDLVHQNPRQVVGMAQDVLRSNGFWRFVDRLRQGRRLTITADHGHAFSWLFSSEIKDNEVAEIMRRHFGSSRCRASAGPWQKRFVPPLVMTANGHHVVMGQRKWKAPGGFPAACHGGMSLLEAVVPYLELPAL